MDKINKLNYIIFIATKTGSETYLAVSGSTDGRLRAWHTNSGVVSRDMSGMTLLLFIFVLLS